MRNSKNISRIIALIISLSVLFSAVPTFNIFVSAAETSGVGAAFQDKVERTGSNADNNAVLFANTGNSLVKTAPTAYNVDNINGEWVERDGSVETNSAYLADRDVEDKYFYDAGWKNSDGTRQGAYRLANHYMCGKREFATKLSEGTDQYGSNIDKLYIDGTTYAVDIVHDLQRSEEISKVIIAHHPTVALRAGHYNLYASENRSDLFKDESLVYKNVYDHVHTRTQIFNFKNTTARYVAIRVFNPAATDDEVLLRSGNMGGENKGAANKSAGNYYIRMFEFNVFDGNLSSPIGESREYSYKATNDETKGDQIPLIDYNGEIQKENNLILGQVPTSAFLQKGATKEEAFAVISGSSSDFKRITDNDSETVIEIHDANYSKFIENNKILNDESKMYLQLNYKLNGEATINQIKMFFHNSDIIAAGHIRVSVAATEEGLFGEEAKNSSDIYNVFGSAAIIKFPAYVKGSYVGIRIICPVKLNCTDKSLAYARVGEISVYGLYTNTVGDIRYNYKIQGSNMSKTGNAEITYSGNVDSAGKYSVGTQANIKTTASIRDSDGNLHSFVEWQDNNGNTIGQNPSLSIDLTTSGTRTIYAIYGTSDKTVTFTFLDYWGNEIHKATVPFGQFVSRKDYEAANSKLGSVPGYKLKYSEVMFGSRRAQMPAWNQDVYNYAADADTTFTPTYVIDDKTYTVTINGVPQDDPFVFDQKITISYSGADYWTVNGVEWCKGTEFVAYVTEDMVIEPKTGSLSQKVALAKNPVISGSSVGFAAKFVDIPDGATINGMGLLLVSGDSTVTEITTTNAQQKIRVTKRSGNEFMVTVSKLPKKVTRRARVYVMYDAPLGSSGTVYSNEVTVTMP